MKGKNTKQEPIFKSPVELDQIPSGIGSIQGYEDHAKAFETQTPAQAC